LSPKEEGLEKLRVQDGITTEKNGVEKVTEIAMHISDTKSRIN
jgi:hypothetical protein